jgi:peptidoglycan/LPS O-acetylase OafA/YrhL
VNERKPEGPARLDALTGLRFAAALGILAFHFGDPLVASGPAWLVRLQQGGHAWVGLFYVLSGFVLAHAHPAPLDAAGRRAFWIARGARLYPAYLLAFLLAAPFAAERWWGLGPVAAAKMTGVAAASLLLVQAWAPPIARLWNAPGWSTSVVASFYAAFPWIAAALARRSRRGLVAALAAAWAVSLAFPLLYLAARPDGPGAEWLPHEPRWLEALKFHPLARAGEFVAGVALGLLHRRGLHLGRAAPAVAAGALALAVGVVASGAAPYVLLHNGLLVPLYALALLGLAPGHGLLARALASRPARTAGDASFALYALQDPLWRWARELSGAAGAPASAAFVLAFSAFAIALAVAVSSGLERPARRWLRARLSGGAGLRALRRRPAPASSAPAQPPARP